MTTYGSAAAVRQALETRLRQQAESRGVDLQRLRRQATFERLLVRLERSQPGRWILKGGLALELRLGDRARTTRDLDLAVRDADTAGAVRELLIDALSRDPDGDGFEFRIESAQELNPDEAGRPGWRFAVEAQFAGRTFAQVRVDVVARTDEITATERLALPGAMAFAGIPTTDIEAASAAQQFAEKLHALTRSYGDGRPSTRVRDLPDLVLLMNDGLAPDRSLLSVVETVFRVRGTHPVPVEHSDPPAAWADVYARIATDLDLHAPTVGDAMRMLRAFWAQTLATKEEE